MVGDRSPMKPAWATRQLAASKTAKGFMPPNNLYIYIIYIYITYNIYILDPKYLYREYFKAKVYTIWIHGPWGFLPQNPLEVVRFGA